MKMKGYNLAQTLQYVQTLVSMEDPVSTTRIRAPRAFTAAPENIDEFLDSPSGGT